MTLKLSVRVMCGEEAGQGEIALGPGKAQLLEAIAHAGSISAAARAMDMSYRRAWLLVDAMNRCWQGPLVATTPGAARGTAARLTPLGQEVLAAYRALEHRLREAAGGDAARLDALLRPAPLERQDPQ